jgi:short-subunit dehydrogenase
VVDLRLEGKVAFVTGASKGIGRCAAEHLAREGCDVVITARTAGPLEAAAGKIAAETGRAVLPLARFINGAHIPIDGAQRKAIMDH